MFCESTFCGRYPAPDSLQVDAAAVNRQQRQEAERAERERQERAAEERRLQEQEAERARLEQERQQQWLDEQREKIRRKDERERLEWEERARRQQEEQVRLEREARGMPTASEDPAAAIRPANRKVELFNDEIFSELRAKAQVPDDFVNHGWDLEQLKAGGGKGGTLMARVGDAYIVKEMSIGDHQALLEIAESYAKHVRAGETLLCPVYLHFADLETGRMFFAMRNSTGPGPFAALYDLKGCADDKAIELEGAPIHAVHKRIWNLRMWCGKGSWTEERVRYFEGKQAARGVEVVMRPEHRSRFLRCMERDTAWLASQQLMDYSLLVALKEPPATASFSALGPNGTEFALHVSIIDFLQKWTNGKRVARCVKFMEPNKATIPPSDYAARFLRHFEERTREVLVGGAEANAKGKLSTVSADSKLSTVSTERSSTHSSKSTERNRRVEAASCAPRPVKTWGSWGDDSRRV